ncbi:MAG: FimB/Mfa2 family fimbrial subunit [Fermentimonas sp.]|jgi:hypothetical protein
MKIRTLIIPMLSTLIMFLYTGCGKYIYDDLEECPQGVNISFYNQTPCMDEPGEVGEVAGLHLFAFDLNDKLVKVEKVEGLVDLVKAYKIELPPVEEGQYSFIAWAGTATKFFDLSDFVVGTTTKEDVMMALKLQENKAAALGDHKVWQGESKVIALPDRKEYGTVFADVAINMLEVTNRIHYTLKLHESVCDKLDIDDFEITISSANGTSLINGRMPLKQPRIIYPGTEIARDDKSVSLDYTLMELKSGYGNELKVYNKKEDKIYFVQDLLGKVLMENPNVNLECIHDFDIVMEIEDKCASCPDNNLVVTIIINDYKIHSFTVELGNKY